MSEAIQERSTPIQSLQQNQGELVDNVENTYQQINESDEENVINDDMYNRQMMGDVNEPHMQHHMSQNVPKPPSMTTNLVNSLKGPLVVLILFVLLNIEFIKSMVITLLSKVINPENSYISLAGLLIRAIICSVLYFVVNKFV